MVVISTFKEASPRISATRCGNCEPNERYGPLVTCARVCRKERGGGGVRGGGGGVRGGGASHEEKMPQVLRPEALHQKHGDCGSEQPLSHEQHVVGACDNINMV